MRQVYTKSQKQKFVLAYEESSLTVRDYCRTVNIMVLPTHVTSEVNLIIKINHHHNLVVVGNGK